MRKLKRGCGFGLLLGTALLLSGCGDDNSVSRQTPPQKQAGSYAPVAPAPPLPAPEPAAQTSDPLTQTPDPLLSGSTGSGDAAPADPLLGHDPLAQRDLLQGRSMPTDHSHWLNTESSNARISISLNGSRLSTYQPSGTQDVTMKLNPGPNTLTVVYTPDSVRSWGSVTLTEGEHQGQAIPLVIFRRAPLGPSAVMDDSAALKPTTQSFTFFAK